ncbi:MAG TPA: MarR family transcriptional regulator [Acidisarcina sp.]
MKKLAKEIGQSRPVDSLEAEAILNLERTTDQIRRKSQQTFKAYGLTAAQYNVLRILRGAQPDGLACSQIGKRMISHDPDVTRLLKRLAKMKLTEQRRDVRDRRIVLTRITAAGLQKLKELDPGVAKETQKALGHMTASRLELLVNLLEEARTGLRT